MARRLQKKTSRLRYFLFGACLVSAVVHRCSCFTPSLVPRANRVVARGRPSKSGRLQAVRPAAASPPTKLVPSSSAEIAATEDTSRGRPSSTWPSNGQREVATAASAADGSRDAKQQTTYQLLKSEVAARRSRAWRIVDSPLPPVEGRDSSHTLGKNHWTPPPPPPPSAATTTAAAAAAAAAALKGGSTTGATCSATADAKLEAQPGQRQRFLDMTDPPSQLAEAAHTRSVDDSKAVTTTNELQKWQQSGGQGDEQGDGRGAGLWASRSMLAGAAMLYGTNFGCVKLLEESVPMSLAAALRFSVALVPFLPFLRKVNPGVFRAGAEVGVLNAIGYWAQSESLMTTSASKSAFICSLAVVFVPVLDALLGATDDPEASKAKAAAKAKSGGLFATMSGPWFPALLAAAGVACLELVGAEGGPNSGDVWALVQPLCFGLGFWLTERCSRKYPEEIFGLVAAQLLTVAAMAVGWCVQAGDLPLTVESLKETVLPSSGNMAVLVSLMWTGLVTTSLTVFGEAVAMKKVSAAESTIILSTEPIWGTAFAACLLGERVGWNTGLGAMLIVSACTWSSVGPSLQAKMLSLVAAAAGTTAAESSGIVDVDDLAETVGTVIQELIE